MYRILRWALPVFFFWSATGWSQSAERITVRGSMQWELGPTTTVITEDEIREKNPATVADLLRDIPGLEIVRQGGPGQTTSLFIRGARSEDTLVLIDGMEGNDAMSPACGFDFSSLAPQNISRIEIYRGPQSVQFGAGALGGVVNIVTKEGRGLPELGYIAEVGAYGTDHEFVGSSAGEGPWSYSLGFERLYSTGFSAANEKDGNTEPDGVEVETVSGKVQVHPSDDSSLTATLRATTAKIGLDRGGGAGSDDPNDDAKTSQFVSGLTGTKNFFQDQLKSNLGFYYSVVRRQDRNAPDAASATDSSDYFLSESYKIQSDHEWLISSAHTLRFGLQWREETGLNQSMYNGSATDVGLQSQSVTGETMTYEFAQGRWTADAGVRANQSSVIGEIPSYRATGSVWIIHEWTRISAADGTGFKLPSLYQLYSNYGNPKLNWENSETREVSIDQKIVQDLSATVTVFDSYFHDMIDFDTATSKYVNISRATSRGAEGKLSWQATKGWKFTATDTYLETLDQSTGLRLVRRPQNSASLAADYRNDVIGGFLQYRFVGERADVDPITFGRVNDKPYNVVDVGGSYAFSKKIAINARIENLFNESYVEADGFGVPGTSGYVGLSGQIGL